MPLYLYSNTTKYITPRVKPNVNCRFWVTMMFQCRIFLVTNVPFW